MAVPARFLLAASPRAPDMNEVVAGLEPGDLLLAAGVGGVCFPVGYAIGAPIRTPAMWTCGFLGTVCGVLLAYQNSCGECARAGWCGVSTHGVKMKNRISGEAETRYGGGGVRAEVGWRFPSRRR